MSGPIYRLFALVVLLFGVLVFFTSRWTVLQAGGLRENKLNRRVLLEQLEIKRGTIRAANGTVLARAVPGPRKTWGRTYPTSQLFAQPVGYANTELGQLAGLEQTRDDALTGDTGEFGSILDQLRGKEKVGDDVRTTLDVPGQKAAYQALGGRKGAVVALNPRTGAVQVMAANPSYNPEHPGKGGSTFNRVTQPAYAPGSTFKVVTASAAIDSGKYQPSSVVDGSSPKTISGTSLSNDGGESFGPIDLTTALTKSVNTVWAQVAVNLGKSTMARYMQRFGFYQKPPLDFPEDQRRASGEYKGQRLLNPRSPLIDVGRMGIGQDKLAVTPLQMAMVAAGVANRGRLMKPHLTDRIVDPDGRTVDKIQSETYSRVMSPGSAEKVSQMMQNVVREGTGTAAALSGIDVAGKTGTAEVGCPGGAQGVQTWFIAFAPAKNPKVAIAATIECSGGQGGTVAAPVAKTVMEAILRGRDGG
jgi:penicillin-binding protein A